MFFLADPEAVAELEEHGHQHAPGEECAFCAAHAADAAALIAAVQFTGRERQSRCRSTPASCSTSRKRKPSSSRARPSVVPGGILTVDATGFYVRR